MAKGMYVLDPRARSRQELKFRLTYSDEKSNETYLGLTEGDFRDQLLTPVMIGERGKINTEKYGLRLRRFRENRGDS